MRKLRVAALMEEVPFHLKIGRARPYGEVSNEACPFFPNAKERLHWSIPDPSRAEGTEEEKLTVYREVRDEIRDRIESELLHAHSMNE